MVAKPNNPAMLDWHTKYLHYSLGQRVYSRCLVNEPFISPGSMNQVSALTGVEEGMTTSGLGVHNHGRPITKRYTGFVLHLLKILNLPLRAARL